MNYDVPIWLRSGRALRQYPWQDGDVRTQVCVVGGGLTGTLCALQLIREGYSVTLVTQRPVGQGVTSRLLSGSLCDCGMSLRTLVRRVGRETAMELLHLTFDAADRLEQLCAELPGGAGFCRRDSVVYADSEADADQLSRDCDEFDREGFDCVEMDRSAFGSAFAFPACGAVAIHNGAVEADPYMLAQLAAAKASDCGAIIFENTKAESISSGSDGRVTVTTSTHRTVTADCVVVAAGEACGEILTGIVPGRTRYVTVSRPVRSFHGWPGRCVLRSFGQPGIICSTTRDDRLMISSVATSADNNRQRLRGALHMPLSYDRHYSELEDAARYLFPEVGASKYEAGWILKGIRTADGLPIVGRTRSHPGCVFAVSGGEGGVLMSMLLSRVAAEAAMEMEPEELRILSPGRRRLAG